MTTPTPPTELPAAVAVPDPNDQTTFDDRMFAFTSWVSALIPNLVAALANVYNNALSAFNSASAAGNSAANSASYASQAQAWATQTGSEVVAGQGFGAKKYAQDAASSAQQAAASVAALPAGTINDGAPSPTAAFSSQKVAADYLAKTGGTLTGPVTGRILGVQGSDVASAAAINLTSAAGGTVDVTGSVSISSITLPAGAECEVRFTGAPLLVNGAALVLKGGANIQAEPGDYALFRGYTGGVVRLVDFSRANGLPVVVSAGALTLLGSAAAGNSAYVDIEWVVSSAYRGYVIDIDSAVPANNYSYAYARMKIGGAYVGSGYRYTAVAINSASSTAGNASSQSAPEIEICGGGGVSNSAGDGGLSCRIEVSAGVGKKKLRWASEAFSQSPRLDCRMGAAINDTAGDLTGVRIYFAGANIASGTFKLYGIAA